MRPGLAVLITLVQTLGTMVIAHGRLDLRGYGLLILSGLALTGRHKNPAATVFVTTAATVAYYLLDYPRGPVFLAMFIAVVVAVAAGQRQAVWFIALLAYIVWVIATGPSLGGAIGVAALLVAGLGIAIEALVTIGRFVWQGIREQERLSRERKLRRASEERLRIAQELHDVLGHHLSLINMRARVGLHLMDRQPDQAREALDTINEASAEALREVRSVLDTLYPKDQAPPRAPAPGLDQLDALTTDAGLPVQTTIRGEPRPVPAEVERAAYRIVQEALTNVRRHAGPGATATVTVDYWEELLIVEIQDDGGTAAPIAAPEEEGNGISGMRERATTLGGALTVEPRPGGGWRIQADLPIPAREDPES